jgi:FMN phosphatase YigB (HAD superfamily)
MRMMGRRLLLCDFDGVICHLDVSSTLKMLEGVEQYLLISPAELLQQFFFTNPYFEEIDSGRISYKEMLERIRPVVWKGDVREWEGVWRRIWGLYSTDSVILRCIRNWKNDGVIITVVTDNHRDFRDWLSVERPQINELADYIICSGETGLRKPDSRVFIAACQRWQVNHNCTIYIDDNEENVKAAKALGITAYLFTVETAEEIGRRVNDHFRV